MEEDDIHGLEDLDKIFSEGPTVKGLQDNPRQHVPNAMGSPHPPSNQPDNTQSTPQHTAIAAAATTTTAICTAPADLSYENGHGSWLGSVHVSPESLQSLSGRASSSRSAAASNSHNETPSISIASDRTPSLSSSAPPSRSHSASSLTNSGSATASKASSSSNVRTRASIPLIAHTHTSTSSLLHLHSPQASLVVSPDSAAQLAKMMTRKRVKISADLPALPDRPAKLDPSSPSDKAATSSINKKSRAADDRRIVPSLRNVHATAAPLLPTPLPPASTPASTLQRITAQQPPNPKMVSRRRASKDSLPPPAIADKAVVTKKPPVANKPASSSAPPAKGVTRRRESLTRAAAVVPKEEYERLCKMALVAKSSDQPAAAAMPKYLLIYFEACLYFEIYSDGVQKWKWFVDLLEKKIEATAGETSKHENVIAMCEMLVAWTCEHLTALLVRSTLNKSNRLLTALENGLSEHDGHAGGSIASLTETVSSIALQAGQLQYYRDRTRQAWLKATALMPVLAHETSIYVEGVELLRVVTKLAFY